MFQENLDFPVALVLRGNIVLAGPVFLVHLGFLGLRDNILQADLVYLVFLACLGFPE